MCVRARMCVSIVWLVVNVLDMSIHICVHRCEYTSVHYAYICPAHLCTIHVYVCVCVSAPALCKTCMPSSMVVCPGPGWCPGGKRHSHACEPGGPVTGPLWSHQAWELCAFLSFPCHHRLCSGQGSHQKHPGGRKDSGAGDLG